MSTTSSKRFLAFAALQTAVVAILAGVALRLVGAFVPLAWIDIGRSGPGAIMATLTLHVFVLVALGLYLAIPVAVAWYVAARGDRHWLAGVAWAGVAVLAVPWLFYSLWMLAGKDGWNPLAGALVLVGGPALVVAADRLAAERGPPGTSARPPPVAFLGPLVAVGVVGGTVAVAFAAPAPPDGLVERQSGAIIQPVPPAVEFEYDYTPTGDGRGVLTVTHDGGRTLLTEQLSLRGTGFADVAGADQTGPGPWRGEATGVTHDGGRTVEPGDSVTVGATNDCEIRVLWQSPGGDTSRRIGGYTCPGGR